MMGLMDHALWQVAVKALLFDGNGQLLKLTTPDGYLDFPGGRVDESERELPWAESLKREVAEELGEAVRFAIGEMAFVSKRAYQKDGVTHHIAAIYFVARYIGGEVRLSDEHAEYGWIDPITLVAGEYRFMSADEGTQLRQYFQKYGEEEDETRD
jgi:8-oxo-dGTP pyrophosphatase MutT (NUDIX family)